MRLLRVSESLNITPSGTISFALLPGPYNRVTVCPHTWHAPRRLRHHCADWRAGWGRSFARATRRWIAKSRLRSCPKRSRRTRTAWRGSSVKTLASLNHPNIAAIYGLEESGGLTALVMELVEGDDLSQWISRGAIPLDEGLPIAKQIAEALVAAREQG